MDGWARIKLGELLFFNPRFLLQPDCETAFAFGNNPFCEMTNPSFTRWGWSIGPIEGSSSNVYKSSHTVHAGAANCVASKGTVVGTVDVEYNGSAVKVTQTSKDGFYMVSVSFGTFFQFAVCFSTNSTSSPSLACRLNFTSMLALQ